jgi:hypothetical protein
VPHFSLRELLTAEYADFADLTLIVFCHPARNLKICVKSAKSAYSAVNNSQNGNCELNTNYAILFNFFT